MAKKVLLSTAIVLALTASSATAGIYTRVLGTYEAHGRVPPCEFTSQQLAAALKGIDTYGAQYFADFSTAVQRALQARGSGVCAVHKKRSSAHAVATPSSTAPLHPGPITAATSSDLPAPLLILAILAALVVLGSVAAWVVWWRGWSPSWAAAWRHMWSEAGFRSQGTWDEFSDWRRSG